MLKQIYVFIDLVVLLYIYQYYNIILLKDKYNIIITIFISCCYNFIDLKILYFIGFCNIIKRVYYLHYSFIGLNTIL